MHRYIFIALLLISSCYINAQPIVKLWDKTIGGGSDETKLSQILVTESKNIIIACKSLSDSGFGKTAPKIATTLAGYYSDTWVVTLDRNGNKIWDKAYSGYWGAIPFDIELRNNNTIIIGSNIHNGDDTTFDISASVTPGTSHGPGIWLQAMDTLGNKLWNKRFSPGSPGNSAVIGGCDLDYDSTGIYVLASPVQFPLFGGDFTASNCGHNRGDFLVFKMPDTSFTAQWQHLYGGDSVEVAQRLARLPGGDFIIGGTTPSSAACNQTVSNWTPGYQDMYLVKINANGDTLRQWHYGGNKREYIVDIIQTNDKGLILYGFSYSNQGFDVSQSLFNDSTLWIVKMDSAGNKLWDKRYAPCQGLQLYNTTVPGLVHHSHNLGLETMDGGLLFATTLTDSAACGDVTENGRGLRDYWVFKTDANGNKLWDKRFGGDKEDWSQSLVELDTGVYIIGGQSNSQAGGDKTDSIHGNLGWDIWLVCFKDTSTVTGFEDYMQQQLQLAIVPNPAKDICTITCPVTNATLTLYDITGRVLLQQAFNSKTELKINLLSKGIYIAEVKNQEGRRVKGKLMKN